MKPKTKMRKSNSSKSAETATPKGLLDGIRSPADIKALREEDLAQLAHEVREELIKVLSQTGGHLGPNLGVVELTIALHRVFDTPRDRFVMDVSHQGYVHKMFTGRVYREKCRSNRKLPECHRHESHLCAFARQGRPIHPGDRRKDRCALCPQG